LEGSSASAQYSRPIDDGDVDGDQQVETDARDRIAYGSKRASRPKVVKHYVPEGMQSPSCGKPHRRVEHSEQAKGGVDANPHQLAHHPQGAFARPNGERHIRHSRDDQGDGEQRTPDYVPNKAGEEERDDYQL
jgi:hypothetical protein